MNRSPLCTKVAAALWAIFAASSVHADMVGHGGPIRSLAVSPDGDNLLSGSFDTAVIRWSLKTETAEQVLRYHADGVNAVAFLKDGRTITMFTRLKLATGSTRI